MAATGLIAIIVIIWNATSTASKEIDDLALANADQRVWRIVEIESNVHSVQHTLLNTDITNQSHLHHLREAFEALETSLAYVWNAEEFKKIKETTEVAAALMSIDAGIQLMKPAFGGDDELLGARVPELSVQIFDLADAAEQLSMASLPAFKEIAQAHRDRVARSLLELALIIVLLFLVLFISVVVLLISIRSVANRTSEIKTTRNRLNAIVGTSLDGIIVADQAGTIIDFNGAAKRIFGFEPSQVIGKDMADLIVPEHMRDAHRAGMKRYAETREKRVLDQGLVQLEAVNSDGQIFPVELSISTAKTDGGEIYVSYIRDISKRVAAQNELVDARDKAVAGEKAKANLLAVMSHEMRTPLNGLIGSLQLLDGTSLSDRQKKFVDVMKTSGQMLLEHVNNVLDISRVDAGKVEKFEQNFDVPEAVNEVVESLKSTASERGNTLSFEVTRDDIGTAFGDKARLTQILVNLIGNALKFTENGRVQVEVERDPNSDVVEFRVIDNGIGIPEDQRQQIFEDFVTLDSSFTRAVEGTGLGLGIVRRLVAILDGEIGVESEAGEGSVFWVRLPLKPVSLKPKTTKQTGDTLTKAVDQSGASFLIIEDNEINRLVAREMLAQMGYISFEANDGQEGVEAADRQAFDLIFCDISMPRMDGIEATKLIRSGGGPNAETPIIALTAHALPDDVAKFRAAGMNDVIVKPLSFESIQDALTTYIKSDDAEPAGSDLESVLGKEKAKEVLAQAYGEINSGLDRLQSIVVDGGAPKSIRDLAHKMSGVAAVVGWQETHSALSEIEDGAFDLGAAELEHLIDKARKIVKLTSTKV